MPTRPFDFPNAAGDRLSGRLELPVGSTRAWKSPSLSLKRV